MQQDQARASRAQWLAELFDGVIRHDHITKLQQRIVLWKYIFLDYATGLYYRIILRDHITASYYGIISWKDITKRHYGIILPDYITELYYGITLQTHIKELDGWIILHDYIPESYYGIVLRNHTRGLQATLGPHGPGRNGSALGYPCKTKAFLTPALGFPGAVYGQGSIHAACSYNIIYIRMYMGSIRIFHLWVEDCAKFFRI